MCWYLLTAAAVDVVVVATANWQHNAARLSYAAYELCMQQARAANQAGQMCVCPSVCLTVCVCLCSNYIYKEGKVEVNGGASRLGQITTATLAAGETHDRTY